MTVLMADLPLQQRPRERLLRQGADVLTDRELLAVLLRNGTQGVSALDLADELLAANAKEPRLAGRGSFASGRRHRSGRGLGHRPAYGLATCKQYQQGAQGYEERRDDGRCG
jgi:DNA repair protein RadC